MIDEFKNYLLKKINNIFNYIYYTPPRDLAVFFYI